MNYSRISFEIPDPFGDGLGDAIAAEQAEPEAIILNERPAEDELALYLESITSDIQQDSEQFTFLED